MGNVGVTNTKSGDYHLFSISSITCWPFTIHLLYLEYGGVCFVFDTPKLFAIS